MFRVCVLLCAFLGVDGSPSQNSVPDLQARSSLRNSFAEGRTESLQEIPAIHTEFGGRGSEELKDGNIRIQTGKEFISEGVNATGELAKGLEQMIAQATEKLKQGKQKLEDEVQMKEALGDLSSSMHEFDVGQKKIDSEMKQGVEKVGTGLFELQDTAKQDPAKLVSALLDAEGRAKKAEEMNLELMRKANESRIQEEEEAAIAAAEAELDAETDEEGASEATREADSESEDEQALLESGADPSHYQHYQYYRINVPEGVVNGNDWWCMDELYLYNDRNRQYGTTGTVNCNVSDTPTGPCCLEDSEYYYYYYGCEMAFGGTMWGGAPGAYCSQPGSPTGTMTYNFGSKQYLRKYMVKMGGQFAPRNWLLQGSNDATLWLTIHNAGWLRWHGNGRTSNKAFWVPKVYLQFSEKFDNYPEGTVYTSTGGDCGDGSPTGTGVTFKDPVRAINVSGTCEFQVKDNDKRYIEIAGGASLSHTFRIVKKVDYTWTLKVAPTQANKEFYTLTIENENGDVQASTTIGEAGYTSVAGEWETVALQWEAKWTGSAVFRIRTIAIGEKLSVDHYMLTADANCAPTNCYGYNKQWSECTRTCKGGGTQYRDFHIVTHPKNGGTACPQREYRSCAEHQDCPEVVFLEDFEEFADGDNFAIKDTADSDADGKTDDCVMAPGVTGVSAQFKNFGEGCGLNIANDGTNYAIGAPKAGRNEISHEQDVEKEYTYVFKIDIKPTTTNNNAYVAWIADSDGTILSQASISGTSWQGGSSQANVWETVTQQWTALEDKKVQFNAVVLWGKQHSLVFDNFNVSVYLNSTVVDCIGKWGGWGRCSESCDGGVQTRPWIVQHRAMNGGKACPADQTKACNTKPCPVDCAGTWNEWAECSLTCGGGKRSRSFDVTTAPKHNGKKCPKPETEACNAQACPIDCYGEWNPWTECPVSCGGTASQTRSLKVIIAPAYGGVVCEADQTQLCNEQACPHTILDEDFETFSVNDAFTVKEDTDGVAGDDDENCPAATGVSSSFSNSQKGCGLTIASDGTTKYAGGVDGVGVNELIYETAVEQGITYTFSVDILPSAVKSDAYKVFIAQGALELASNGLSGKGGSSAVDVWETVSLTWAATFTGTAKFGVKTKNNNQFLRIDNLVITRLHFTQVDGSGWCVDGDRMEGRSRWVSSTTAPAVCASTCAADGLCVGYAASQTTNMCVIYTDLRTERYVVSLDSSFDYQKGEPAANFEIAAGNWGAGKTEWSEAKCYYRDCLCCGGDKDASYTCTNIGANDGDCDADTDCKEGLVCGTDNCNKGHFGATDDCCMEPVASTLPPSTTEGTTVTKPPSTTTATTTTTAAPTTTTTVPSDCVGSWNDWGICDQTCGWGYQERTFAVTTPASNGGKACPSSDPDAQACMDMECPRDCVYEWGAWGDCPGTCGGHQRQRSPLVSESTKGSGNPCPADELEACGTIECPVDCVGDWGEFSECTEVCDGGTQTRSYTATTIPGGGGVACPADETQACNTQDCPEPAEDVDCTGAWTEWTTCSKTCGQGGTQAREYSVLTPSNGAGLSCPPEETQDCFISGCPHGYGDPHLQNMNGESFDVHQTGNMMMFECPRGSTPETLNLAIHADIERFGAARCGPTYITKLHMNGGWLGDPVELHAGYIAQRGDSSLTSFGVRLGKMWMSQADFVAKMQDGKKAYRYSNDTTVSTYGARKFILNINVLKIVVSQPSRQRGNFLDVDIKGVGKLHTDVGGLLGIDDYSWSASKTPECKAEMSFKLKRKEQALGMDDVPEDDHEDEELPTRAHNGWSATISL